VPWLGIARSKFFDWKTRYGHANEHNALVPRDHWIEPWERAAIIHFYLEHRTDGYRRVTFMMLDLNLVAVSPSTTYRVLAREDLLRRWNATPTKKGTGFEQPLAPHEHWHMDISHINIHGTFYYLCCALDGYSRAIIHWDIRAQMTEGDVEIILQGARERFPEARPRIISDNGPQFVAGDFKQFIRMAGMTHVRTSPYYPQSNGKIERFHQSIKAECIRPQTPLTLEDAKRITGKYVDYYNNERLHSAIGFIAPADKLAGREKEICNLRDRRLEEARERRRQARQNARPNPTPQEDSTPNILTDSTAKSIIPTTGETDAGSAGEQPARDNRPKFDEMNSTGVDNHARSGADSKRISENLPMPEKTHTQATLNPTPVLSNSG
jgi:putative transposase